MDKTSLICLNDGRVNMSQLALVFIHHKKFIVLYVATE